MTTSTTDGSSTRSAHIVVAALVLFVAACSSGGAETTASSVPDTPPSTALPSTTTTTTSPTTTTAPPVTWPAVPTDGVARAVQTKNGIVLPVTAANSDGTFNVDTPCSNRARVSGTPISGANVVLDPGHGGNETGAIGPGGLVEKDVNFAVAQEMRQLLEAQGARVVLTRTGDYNTTVKTRAEIAAGLQPQVFVSIHHNANPDGPSDVPGNETFYQIASPNSKRLAGLMWEEITAAFTPYHVAWMAETDHGAKYRANAGGSDYYGILRDASGVTTVLSEAAFISNPAEEHLLADPAFRHVEAEAITRAIVRYVTTNDPGGGYVTPYARTGPAGPGGGPQGCTDPPL
jgi:N-acetylmuramoyl-L-alanine amidase